MTLQQSPYRGSRFNFSDSSLHDEAIRKGVFREAARDILRKDRAFKSAGFSQDTGGSITRALEQAYKLGFMHAKQNRVAVAPFRFDPNRPIVWTSLPPRARSAFESIARCDWVVVLQPNPNPVAVASAIWACYFTTGGANPRVEFSRTYSVSTLKPMVELGLMEEITEAQDIFLRITTKGRDTLELAVQGGHIRPKES